MNVLAAFRRGSASGFCGFMLVALICLNVLLCHGDVPGNEYSFARDFIRGLSYLKSNEEIDKGGPDPPGYVTNAERGEAIMERFRVMRENALSARALIAGYGDSDNPLIKRAAVLSLKSYDMYIRASGDILKMQSELWDTRGEVLEDPGFMARMADYQYEMDTSLGMLTNCSLLVTHALLSMSPDKNGKLTRLVITSEERAALTRQLEDVYGEGVKAGLQEDQPYIDMCGGILFEGLTGVHQAADEGNKEGKT
jgi:hypothetical protein